MKLEEALLAMGVERDKVAEILGHLHVSLEHLLLDVQELGKFAPATHELPGIDLKKEVRDYFQNLSVQPLFTGKAACGLSIDADYAEHLVFGPDTPASVATPPKSRLH